MVVNRIPNNQSQMSPKHYSDPRSRRASKERYQIYSVSGHLPSLGGLSGGSSFTVKSQTATEEVQRRPHEASAKTNL
eukprot:3585487-Amphidinium_carterae.1